MAPAPLAPPGRAARLNSSLQRSSEPPGHSSAAAHLPTLSIEFEFPLTLCHSLAPRPVRCCRFSRAENVYAIVLQNDQRVAIWSYNSCDTSKPRLDCTLYHSRPVVHLAWRKAPHGQSQARVLITRTEDGVARIWAPVIDDPQALRMISVIDPASMVMAGRSTAKSEHQMSEASSLNANETSPALYLDAGDVAQVLRATLKNIREDLERAAELDHQTQKTGSALVFEQELDLKRSRVRRLEHLLCETPDLFLCFDRNGSLTVKAVANIDRRPPTLCETFTVLKLFTCPSASPSNYLNDHLQKPPWPSERCSAMYSASLIPMQAMSDSLGNATGCLILSLVDDARRDYEAVKLLFSPDLLFDGLETGLRRWPSSADLATTCASARGIEEQCEATSRYDGDILGMAVEQLDSLRRPMDRSADKGTHQANHPSSRHEPVSGLMAECRILEKDGRPDSDPDGCGVEQVRIPNSTTPSETIAITITDTRQSFLTTAKQSLPIRSIPPSVQCSTPPILVWHSIDARIYPPILTVVFATYVRIIASQRLTQWQSSQERWSSVAHLDLADFVQPGSTILTAAWLTGRHLLIAMSNGQTLLFNDTLINVPQAGRIDPFQVSKSCVAAHPNGDVKWHSHPRLSTLVMLRAGPLPELDAEVLMRYMLWGRLTTALSLIDYSRLAESKSSDRQLKTVIELAYNLRRLQGQLDDHAMRYLVAYTYEEAHMQLDHSPPAAADQSYRHRRKDRELHTAIGADGGERLLDVRTTKRAVFGLYSETQEALLQQLTSSPGQRAASGVGGGGAQLDWPLARQMGLFLWLQSSDALRRCAETVARAQFTTGDNQDPSACAMWYYALGKAGLVVNLWRQAIWHPEQRKMIHFLQNDFGQPRWRSAAQKNAFALLSQRRFEMAAAFFLLGDSLQDAVNVCVRNIRDLSLAIALCRIWHDASAGRRVLRRVLIEVILPDASCGTDRWMMAWTMEMLERRDLALLAIASHPDTYVGAIRRILNVPLRVMSVDSISDTAPQGIRDAEAVLIYKHLVMSGTGLPVTLPADIEASLVSHAARLLRRDGMPLLALSLVREWTFSKPSSSTPRLLAVASSRSGGETIPSAQALEQASSPQLDRNDQAEGAPTDHSALSDSWPRIPSLVRSTVTDGRQAQADLAFNLDDWTM